MRLSLLLRLVVDLLLVPQYVMFTALGFRKLRNMLAGIVSHSSFIIIVLELTSLACMQVLTTIGHVRLETYYCGQFNNLS